MHPEVELHGPPVAVPVERKGPSPAAATHLGLAFIAFAILGIAQLWAFAQMAVLGDRTSGLRALLVAIAGGSFLLFTVVSLVRQALLMAFAYSGAIGTARVRPESKGAWPGVTILVPAFNEAGRIEKAIEGILALDYPRVEAIVVDDGSTDDTFAVASRFKGRKNGKLIHVVRKENGGKWSALNVAFHLANEELIVCVDADSQLAPDSLKVLARHFEDPKVGGCCGQVVVRNTVNLITRLQQLEYMLLNGILRQAQNAFGLVLVAPGPIAMFRRSVLREVWMSWGSPQPLPLQKPGKRVYGPWEDDTFAEDADLTLNILLTGHSVLYDPRAVSRTSAPDNTFALLNQRYRWTRGNFQAAIKAWRRYGTAPKASRMLPVWLGSLLFETVVWPALNLYGMGAFMVMIGVFGLQLPLLGWFLALTFLDLNAAAFAARIEGGDTSVLLLTPLSRIYFNLLLDVSKAFALYDELRGRRMSWS